MIPPKAPDCRRLKSQKTFRITIEAVHRLGDEQRDFMNSEHRSSSYSKTQLHWPPRHLYSDGAEKGVGLSPGTPRKYRKASRAARVFHVTWSSESNETACRLLSIVGDTKPALDCFSDRKGRRRCAQRLLYRLALHVANHTARILLLGNERSTTPGWTVLMTGLARLLTATLIKHSRPVVFVDPSC